MRLDVGKLGGNSEVGNLDRAILCEEDVRSFDVTVDLVRAVKVVETEQ